MCGWYTHKQYGWWLMTPTHTHTHTHTLIQCLSLTRYIHMANIKTNWLITHEYWILIIPNPTLTHPYHSLSLTQYLLPLTNSHTHTHTHTHTHSYHSHSTFLSPEIFIPSTISWLTVAYPKKIDFISPISYSHLALYPSLILISHSHILTHTHTYSSTKSPHLTFTQILNPDFRLRSGMVLANSSEPHSPSNSVSHYCPPALPPPPPPPPSSSTHAYYICLPHHSAPETSTWLMK